MRVKRGEVFVCTLRTMTNDNELYTAMLEDFKQHGVFENLEEARRDGQTPLIDGMVAYMLAQRFGLENLQAFCDSEKVTLLFPSALQLESMRTGHAYARQGDEVIDLGDRRD